MNYGGFVDLSTSDWPGKSVCAIFLRGCPLNCSYCHNKHLKSGTDIRTTDEIMDMILKSKPLISGVVFSGGEPTLQVDSILELIPLIREQGLGVAIQTSGCYPDAIKRLVNQVDRIQIDYKNEYSLQSIVASVKCHDLEVSFTVEKGDDIIPQILTLPPNIKIVIQRVVYRYPDLSEPISFIEVERIIKEFPERNIRVSL